MYYMTTNGMATGMICKNCNAEFRGWRWNDRRGMSCKCMAVEFTVIGAIAERDSGTIVECDFCGE